MPTSWVRGGRNIPELDRPKQNNFTGETRTLQPFVLENPVGAPKTLNSLYHHRSWPISTPGICIFTPHGTMGGDLMTIA